MDWLALRGKQFNTYTYSSSNRNATVKPVILYFSTNNMLLLVVVMVIGPGVCISIKLFTCEWFQERAGVLYELQSNGALAGAKIKWLL